MMEGLSGYIAQLSMTMAQQNVQASFSTGMLKNVMDSQEAANAQLLDMLSMPSADGKGTILDVRA